VSGVVTEVLTHTCLNADEYELAISRRTMSLPAGTYRVVLKQYEQGAPCDSDQYLGWFRDMKGRTWFDITLEPEFLSE
jgi:hypothetical protein